MPSFTKFLTGAISSLSDRQLGSLPQYAYAPLPHPRCIRLLEIHEQSTGPLLNCTLHVCDLDTALVFDALSYTWGNPLPPIHHTSGPSIWTMQRPILCNGTLIRVTTNLHTALRKVHDYITKPGALPVSRLLWVDAVCINQADIEERSAQVSIMEDIYSRARMVIAWLGLSDRKTGKAIQCITHISRFPESDGDRSNAWSLEQKGVPTSDARAMMGFFMREWFNRAWVVQEVVLASRLVLLCGDYLLDWDVLVRCAQFLTWAITPTDLLQYIPEFLTAEQRRLLTIVKRPGYDIYGLQVLKSQLEEPDLNIGATVSFVYIGRVRDSSDPRDRVFSTLGLFKRQPRIRSDEALRGRIPTPDYSKSVADVFADAAVLVMELTKDAPLFLLSMVEDQSRRNPELVGSLPSWVADLTVPLSPDPLVRLSPSRAGNENADARLWGPGADYNNNVANPVSIGGKFLRLEGAMFETITQVSNPLEVNEASFSWADVLDAFRPQWAGQVSGTVFMDALWRTLTANMEKIGGSLPASAQFGWGFVELLLRRAVIGPSPLATQRLIDVLTQASSASGAGTPIAPEKIHQCLAILRGPPSQQVAAVKARIEAYRVMMETVCGTRRLLLTNGQYLGIGPRSTAVGDQIWIFPGASVPFVLRPRSSGRFRLVGEAYVHGIMYGEAAPSLLEKYQDIELE